VKDSNPKVHAHGLVSGLGIQLGLKARDRVCDRV